MPKSSKEISAVPRVTRSLRNRLVSVEYETPGRTTPTLKKESILENDNKDEKSAISTPPTTPARVRFRRSSQSEVTNTPVKTPARRLSRRTSLSELDNATISSPLRRSTRKVSTLVENVIYVESSDEEEEENRIEKQVARSSSKSPSLTSSNKIKTATENIAMKKGVSKGKKSRSPSPLAIQEENDNQINKTQSGGIDKKHTPSVLPTVREDMEETLQAQKSTPKSKTSNELVKNVEDEKEIIMEKRATRSSSKSPKEMTTENIDATKEGSGIRMLKVSSLKNSSNTTQEKNDNEKDASKSSGDSDKLHIPTVLFTACEEPQKLQKSDTVDLVKERKEKENMTEKQVTGSVLSGSELVKKTVKAGEKPSSKGEKSRSPSPRKSSKTAQEKNDNEKDASKSSGDSDKLHIPTVLSTACEEPQKLQKSDTVDLVKERKEKENMTEKQVTGSVLSGSELVKKTVKAGEKPSSKGEKSRSPSPRKSSKTAQEKNDNEKDASKSSGDSDKLHIPTVLSTACEEPQKLQKSDTVGLVKERKETENMTEKQVTGSVLSGSELVKKTVKAGEKPSSKGEKSRSPSPRKSSKTAQEKNDNEKDASKSSGDSDKLHIPTVLSTACEEPQQLHKSDIVDLVKDNKEKEIIIEKQLTDSNLKSPSGLFKTYNTGPEIGKTKKTGSKGEKSRSPSPFNISTAKEDSENQVGETQLSRKSDANCNPTVLSTVLEDPMKIQELSQSLLPKLLADKENEKEPAPDTTEKSRYSELAVEITGASRNIPPMKSPNPIEKVQEVVSPSFKRVTRSASKSPVISVEKETRKEKLSKKNLKDSIAEASENKVVEEAEKQITISKEAKKIEPSAIEIKDNEIKKTTINVEPIEEAKNATEVAGSPKKITAVSPKKITAVEIKETGITKKGDGEANEINKESESIVLPANPSTLAEATQNSEKDLISFETNSGLTKQTTEVLNMEEKEELFHHSLCEDFNNTSIIKADISISEVIEKCSDDKKEEEKENRQPENEVNIVNSNMSISSEHTSNIEHVENKSNKSEDSKIDKDLSKNAEESIIDQSLDTSSTKEDTSSIKHPQSESEICEAPIKENIEVTAKVSSKKENVLDRSLGKSNEHLPNEESISSFSKSSQIANIDDETFDESILNKTDIFKEKERTIEKPIEDQTEVNKKQKSVVFDTDSEKASVNYPKTPIFSKSKSYVADSNSSVDTSIIQKLTSKREITLDDSKKPEEECAIETVEGGEVNEVVKPNTPLNKIKSVTILSSTPIINSNEPTATDCVSFDRKKNTSIPLGSNSKDDKHGFSKSWSQAILGKAEDGENGAPFIDALEHEKKKEREAVLIEQIKKSLKDIKPRAADNSEDDEDDEEEEQERNEFIDDEAMEVKDGEESMDSEERRYLEENEIPEHGESIGSEDTDQEESEEDDDDHRGGDHSLDSFIASDADEELLSVESVEFSSGESTDEEQKVPKTKTWNISRRIESSEESDQDDEQNLKTKKTSKLMVESSDEESEDHNEDPEIDREVRNERKNQDENKEQEIEKNNLQAIDASPSRQDNGDVPIPCSKIEKKQTMPKELESSSYMELSNKEVTNNTINEENNCSTALDKCQKINIWEVRVNLEEKSAPIKSKPNDDEGRSKEIEQKTLSISSKEIKRRSSLKTMSTNNKKLENLKETGGSVIRNLNSSGESLSATEKNMHSKAVHENETDRAENTTHPILLKESDKVLLLENPSEDINIKDHDKVLKTHAHEEEPNISEHVEPVEDLHKTKKGKIQILNRRVFSASFTLAEKESSEVEKLSSSFTSIPKKSKKIKENKETNQSIKKILPEDGREKEILQEGEEENEVLQKDEVLYGSSNLEEQSSSNNSSEVHLDKTFTDTSEHNEVSKGKKKNIKPKTPKRTKVLQKSTIDYSPEIQENVEERTLEECYEEDSEISNTSPVPDCSINSAKQFEAKTKQLSSDAKEIRDLSPILQALNKSEARLETLIFRKQLINRKIKKMNMKLQQLFGKNSPKSNEVLDDHETAKAVALKHGLSLLGKQKRKVFRELKKMNYMPSESESSSEEAATEVEQKPKKTKRKEKVVCTENKELIPSRKSEKPSTSKPKKRKREDLKTLAETHEQSHAAYRQSLNFVRTTSGIFVEEPNSPEIQKTKKFRITSTLELPFGVVFEEAVTPNRKVVNGFQVTQATPRAIGFKVESILPDGQKEVSSVKKPGIKRKLDLSESTEVLPKPKWGNSGNFSVKKLRTGTGSSGYIPLNVNESASTHFMVAPLKPKKSRASSQAGPSTMKAMEFKATALSKKNIPRESSHNILQRKQKKRANQL